MTERPTQIEDQQRRVADLLRSFDAPAPQALHRHVDSLVASRQRHRWALGTSGRRVASPLRLAGAAALVAVVVVVIALAVNGGAGTHTAGFGQTAAVTLRPATLPAPAESQTHHTQLAAAVDGVAFPYWGERFGWHSTGARTDQLDGRAVKTVFYTDPGGQRIGYAILSGTPAPRVGGGMVIWRNGVGYRLLNENGAAAVTWLRDGRLCVVSGRGVSSATLLALASWNDRSPTAS